ncbi:uncharacterized protein BDR25DRAFT_238016, partial [Lindgomyces ingoldianus]
STLINSFPQQSSVTAVIVPGQPALTVSFTQLSNDIRKCQRKLAALGITHESAVSIVLLNSCKFIVSFLAASWQRGIAAPLNPNYKQSEVEFYIDDLLSSLALVPKGAFAANAPSVRATRKYRGSKSRTKPRMTEARK